MSCDSTSEQGGRDMFCLLLARSESDRVSVGIALAQDAHEFYGRAFQAAGQDEVKLGAKSGQIMDQHPAPAVEYDFDLI